MKAIIFLADKNVTTNIKDYKSNLLDALIILQPTKEGIAWHEIFVNMSNSTWQEYFQNAYQFGESKINTVEFLLKGLRGLDITKVELCDMNSTFGEIFNKEFKKLAKDIYPELSIGRLI